MYSCSARAGVVSDAEASVMHIVSEMDYHLNDEKGCAQIVWVVDFAGFRAKHANPDLGRVSVNLFQQLYPERLGQLVLLDFPWLFNVFYKIISPLLVRTKCILIDQQLN
jgi:CRAL/TRIO domain